MEFKVGDRVKVKNNCSHCELGKIYIVYGKYGTLFARNEEMKRDGIFGCSCSEDWVLVEESDELESDFKVGDRVKKVSDKSNYSLEIPIGKIGMFRGLSKKYDGIYSAVEWRILVLVYMIVRVCVMKKRVHG